MCFLSVGDLYGQFEAVVFPGVFDRTRQYLSEDAKIKYRNERKSGFGGAANMEFPFYDAPNTAAIICCHIAAQKTPPIKILV